MRVTHAIDPRGRRWHVTDGWQWGGLEALLRQVHRETGLGRAVPREWLEANLRRLIAAPRTDKAIHATDVGPGYQVVFVRMDLIGRHRYMTDDEITRHVRAARRQCRHQRPAHVRKNPDGLRPSPRRRSFRPSSARPL